jgi:hypothetical protein
LEALLQKTQYFYVLYFVVPQANVIARAIERATALSQLPPDADRRIKKNRIEEVVTDSIKPGREKATFDRDVVFSRGAYTIAGGHEGIQDEVPN